MMNHLVRLGVVCLTLVASATLINGQTNLLKNPNADLQSQYWRTYGKATIETCNTGKSCFVVRNGGYFYQDVTLPDDAAGQYALFIGRGMTGRFSGAITGLPYLYGYMMSAEPNGRILDYLQGQNMLASPAYENEWVTMSGIFRVPVGTKTIRFFLNHALRKGTPHNGFAACFDDVGLYTFAREQDARSFIDGRH